MSASKSKSSLSDRLLRYSATASLISAGLIATVPQSTVAGTTITNDWGSSGTVLPSSLSGSQFAMDVDGFADNDLAFNVRSGPSPQIQLLVQGTETISFLGNATGGIFVIPDVIPYGAPISNSAGTWTTNSVILLTSSGLPIPITIPWSSQDGTEKNYVGFYIQGDDGNPHYGWIELEVTAAAMGGPHVVVYRTAIDSPAGAGLPADVTLTTASASGGLQTTAAGAFAALGGVLTWIRRKLKK